MGSHWPSALAMLGAACALAAGIGVAGAQEAPRTDAPAANQATQAGPGANAAENGAPAAQKLAPPPAARFTPVAPSAPAAEAGSPPAAPPKSAPGASQTAATPAVAAPSRSLFAAQLDEFGMLLEDMHGNCVAGLEAERMGDAAFRSEQCFCQVNEIAVNFSPLVLNLFRADLTEADELNIRRAAPPREIERLETFFNDLNEGRGEC